MKPNSSLAQRTSSSASRVRCTAAMRGGGEELDRGVAVGRPRRGCCAATRAKPRARARRSARSSAKPAPASAPAPSGSSSARARQSREAAAVASPASRGRRADGARAARAARAAGACSPAGWRVAWRRATVDQRALQARRGRRRSRAHSARSQRRRSSATWSLRLRPVWSLPPSGPISSVSRRSIAMWMSSSAGAEAERDRRRARAARARGRASSRAPFAPAMSSCARTSARTCATAAGDVVAGRGRGRRPARW